MSVFAEMFVLHRVLWFGAALSPSNQKSPTPHLSSLSSWDPALPGDCGRCRLWCVRVLWEQFLWDKGAAGDLHDVLAQCWQIWLSGRSRGLLQPQKNDNNNKKTLLILSFHPFAPRQQTDLLSSASFLDINLSNFLEGRSSIHAFHNLLSSPGILASLWPVRVPDHGSRGGWPQAQLAPIS